MERVEVITGHRRRRRWSWEDKARIVAEASAPGVCASEVARRYDMQPQQLFQWRRELRESQGAHGTERFAAVRLIAGHDPGRQHEPGRAERDDRQAAGTAEIRLDNGRVLRVRETIAPAALTRLIAAIEQA
jgi:transposase